MNVLIIGSGGREHSLFTTVKLDPRVSDVYMLGVNGAIDSKYLISEIDPFDFKAVYDFICEKEIKLTIVGPEIYLEAGIVDYLRSRDVSVIGPTKYCAMLESSKSFAKELMSAANIPTAQYQYVTNSADGIAAITKYPVVLKYDGLAAGKGVVICTSKEQALAYFESVFTDNCFGNSGVVVEECLFGEEYSVFAVVDGENYSILPIAQDYKRAYDNDQGENTGGMGANTTSKYDYLLPTIEDEILKPLLTEFINRGNKYTGFLYIGLMQTDSGPKVIEFNVRMGDPETQIVLQKLDSSLITIFEAVSGGINYRATFKSQEYVGVVLAGVGYPKQYKKNVILKLNENMRPVYHMGSVRKNGVLYSTGGRVMMITSGAKTVKEARDNVYQKLESFTNDDLFYRTDIGKDRI